MRIVILTPEYPSVTYGGIASIAQDLAHALADRSNEVIIITRRHTLSKIRSRRNGKIKIVDCFSPNIPPKSIFFYMLNLKKITNVIEEIKPDVVHDMSLATSFIPWLSRKYPVIVTVHGSPQLSKIRANMSSFNDSLRDSLFKEGYLIPSKVLTTLIKPDVKKYVFVSKFCLLDTLNSINNPILKRKLMAKSEVIYNGVNLEYLKKLKEKVTKINSTSIAFIGRLMEYKGIKYLIKAFEYSLKKVKNAELHIIGGGPLYHEIQNTIRQKGLTERIILHGYLPRPMALEILANSAFLVHPSLYEALPMSVIEAYALGKPVLVHKAGYAFEVVEEDRAGILVNVTNIKEFSDAIIELMTNKSLYRNLSKNAERVAREKFDIKIIAEKYESLFKEVLASE
jgi:glycosyltransferase involved in cell wall biosynthesis